MRNQFATINFKPVGKRNFIPNDRTTKPTNLRVSNSTRYPTLILTDD
jgi:hypothetical protein